MIQKLADLVHWADKKLLESDVVAKENSSMESSQIIGKSLWYKAAYQRRGGNIRSTSFVFQGAVQKSVTELVDEAVRKIRSRNSAPSTPTNRPAR